MPFVQLVHDVAFRVFEYVPAAQVPHARSLVLEPEVRTYEPEVHVVHAVHALAFVVVEYVPAPQFAQVRFVVVDGVLVAYWPAVHVVHMLQLEAPAAEYVAGPHPLQVVWFAELVYVPAAQVPQVRSVVVLPAPVW